MITQMHPRAGAWLLLVCVLLLGSGGTTVAATKVTASTFKAALVYKLTKFVDWPEASISQYRLFRLCTLGSNVLNGELSTLSGKITQTLPIHLVEVGRFVEQIRGCHMLFVKASEADNPALKTLVGEATLVISDARDFARNRGDIEIKRVGKAYLFVINLERVKAKGMDIAVPLLQLSTVIKGRKP